VASLKTSAELVKAIEPAVRLYEEPPTKATTVTTPWLDVRVTAADWAEAFEAPGSSTATTSSRCSATMRTPGRIDRITLAALLDANVPTSIRSSGLPVLHGSVADLAPILETWLAQRAEGIACVVGDPFGDGIEGAVDRYVAMTRAPQQLVELMNENSVCI
jgi:hypothetical protein